jgi:hypothetical protein
MQLSRSAGARQHETFSWVAHARKRERTDDGPVGAAAKASGIDFWLARPIELIRLRLTRRYPRGQAVYVAHPIRSIVDLARDA